MINKQIVEITDEQKEAIRKKAPHNLPDRPTDAGWGAAKLKSFLSGPLVDDNNSLLALMVNIVSQINAAIEQICNDANADNTNISDAHLLLKGAFDDLNNSIYEWAKTPQKPSYTCDEVGAMPSNTFIPSKTSDLTNDGNGQSAFAALSELEAHISEHGRSSDTHGDIRTKLAEISARLSAILDSDDTTLDELSEIVAYIKSNKELIDAITVNKISVSDIINNLTSDISDKPLAAAQGVVLAGLIAGLTQRFDDFVHAGGEADPTVPAWAKQPTKPSYTADEVGAMPDSHGTDTQAHNDIRIALQSLADRLAAVLNSDDETLDELSEIVAYIKSNKDLIDAITASKVNKTDIVNDLLSDVADKPLSAAQGVVLYNQILESLYSKHFGTSAGTICEGNDSRLSDSRTPKSHASLYSTYGLSSASLYGHSKASSTLPKMNGTASAGSETSSFARGDHVHPEDTSKLNSSELLNKTYPIGIVIELYTNDSPAMLFGGDWTKLQSGRCTIAANGHTMAPTYNGDTMGGSADAVLVKHNHTFEVIKGDSLKVNYNYATLNATGTSYNYPSVGTGAGGDHNGYIRLTESGVDGTGMNMQPWIAVHKWQRIG